MKERPIIFNGKMVQAILNGHKTQTRRVMKPQPVLGRPWKNWTVDPDEMDLPTAYCPHGIARDHLWVRETAGLLDQGDDPKGNIRWVEIYYKAGGENRHFRRSDFGPYKYVVWTSSRFMPRWASRITLEITSVRVERLQDISTKDAIAEGWPGEDEPFRLGEAKHWFQALWDSINAKNAFGWDVDPWVWVIEFKVR